MRRLISLEIVSRHIIFLELIAMSLHLLAELKDVLLILNIFNVEFFHQIVLLVFTLLEDMINRVFLSI